MQVKAKHAEMLSRVWISVSMSLSISFFMTIINKVPGDRFLVSWLSSSLIGTIIGIPLASIYVPNILKKVERMKIEEEIEEDIEEQRKVNKRDE